MVITKILEKKNKAQRKAWKAIKHIDREKKNCGKDRMGKSIVQARCSSMPAQALAASAAGRASVQHSPSAEPFSTAPPSP